MNPSFREVITAADGDRLDLFLGAATRMGTAVQNVEKDFWVCWTLDTLFNGLAKGGPRMGGGVVVMGVGLIIAAPIAGALTGIGQGSGSSMPRWGGRSAGGSSSLFKGGFLIYRIAHLN